MKTNQLQKNIPASWQQVKLGDISDIYSGGTPDTNNQDFWNGKINWITPTEITKTGKYINLETEKKITELGLKNSSARLLPKGSLVVCTRATVGECSISTYPISTNQGFKNLIPKKDTTVDYLYYFIKSIKPKLIKLGSGSTFLEVSKGDIEKLKLHLPPLPEQNRIVSVLETWDKVIENLNKKIEIKKQIKKGLMQDLLTGRKRLAGFKDKWKKVKLGDLEDLKIIKLGRGEVISKTDIKNFPGENPIYSSSVHNNALFGKYSKHMFDEELISWSVDGGGHFFHRPKHKFSITNVSGFMRVDTNIFNYMFLASQLQLLHSKKYFDYQFKAHPSVIREEYYISYPDIKEQNTIANILTIADKEITELEKKLSIIKDQKKYLLNNLITGVIRTPENLKVN